MTLDSHLHLWDSTRFDYPWMAAVPGLPARNLPEDVEESVGPDYRAVVVEAGITPDQALAEVDWISEAAVAHPWIVGIVAAVDLLSETLDDRLSALRKRPLVRGVRDNFEGLDLGAIPTTERRDAILAVLAAGLRVDLCIRAAQIPELTVLLGEIVEERGSGSGLIIDHCAKPDLNRPFDEWHSGIRELAALPGLHVKLSGLTGQVPGRVDQQTAVDLVDRWGRAAIEAFGSDRVLAGSDHPVSTTAHGLSLSDSAVALETLLASLPSAGAKGIRETNTETFYATRSR